MHPARIVLLRTLTTILAIIWTIAVAFGVAIGTFAAADTRCGSTAARVNMTGGWWVRTRSRLSGSIAVATVVTGIVVVTWLFTHPTRFCW
jgi:hypothetical protein